MHKKYVYGTVLDERGRVMKRGKFEYTRNGFEEFLCGIDDAKVAMEAGYCWQLAYELLEDIGYDVELARPMPMFLSPTNVNLLAGELVGDSRAKA